MLIPRQKKWKRKGKESRCSYDKMLMPWVRSGRKAQQFGLRSWRTGPAQRGQCVVNSSQYFSCPARAYSVNKYILWHFHWIAKRPPQLTLDICIIKRTTNDRNPSRLGTLGPARISLISVMSQKILSSQAWSWEFRKLTKWRISDQLGLGIPQFLGKKLSCYILKWQMMCT